MPFTIRPYRRIPVQCVLSYHAVLWSLIVVLVLSSEPAFAEWVLISDDEERALYVDRDTIRRKGDLVKLWQLYDFKSVQSVGGQRFLSMRVQNEFDCAEERTRQLARTAFSGNMLNGNVIYTDSIKGIWDPVPPDTTAQILWKVACGKK